MKLNSGSKAKSSTKTTETSFDNSSTEKGQERPEPRATEYLNKYKTKSGTGEELSTTNTSRGRLLESTTLPKFRR